MENPIDRKIKDIEGFHKRWVFDKSMGITEVPIDIAIKLSANCIDLMKLLKILLREAQASENSPPKEIDFGRPEGRELL
ncbi:hypothetical protein [Shouchella clausii]|uniref:hypothetical protein n=1 Tax=Shouchella clausii TaxID=79880 RepID=UPI001C734C62|nr:hypothetical protein [Shouchella clausii]MBX0320292.1 hypothetical protein [Shouchella clausii]